MFKSLFLTLGCATLFATSVIAQEATDAPKNADRLPSIELANVDGAKVNVASYGESGKPTIFSFWATWCAPCKKELNNMADIYDDWKEKYNVHVVAISTDDTRTSPKVKPYVNGQAWEYDVLLDVNEDLKRALNFQTVPYTILTDAKGNIVYRHIGYKEGDEHELEEELKKITTK